MAAMAGTTRRIAVPANTPTAKDSSTQPPKVMAVSPNCPCDHRLPRMVGNGSASSSHQLTSQPKAAAAAASAPPSSASLVTVHRTGLAACVQAKR
jgi:hypothetical protein